MTEEDEEFERIQKRIDQYKKNPRWKEWVGLTEEDMKDPRTHDFAFIHGARWAENKLKERNT